MNEEMKRLVEEAEARAAAATSDGPWKRYGLQVVCAPAGSENTNLWIGIANCYTEGLPSSVSNAEFIAHARQDVPALCAEIRRLDEKVRWLCEEFGYPLDEQ